MMQERRSDGRNPKRVRELKRWRDIASLAISGLPSPVCDAAKDFELWIYDNRRALSHALMFQDGEQAGMLPWKEFKKAAQRFCCTAMNMAHSDGKAAVKALETSIKMAIKQGPAGRTPHATAGQRGGATRPSAEGGFTVRESPVFLGDEGGQQDEWGSPSKSLPALTPNRSVRRGGNGGEGHPGSGGGISKVVSIPDDVSVSTRYIREVVFPEGQVKSLLQRGGLDRREKEVVRKAQELQWRMLYDVKEAEKKKKEVGGGEVDDERFQSGIVTVEEAGRAAFAGHIPAPTGKGETREEREARRKAARDELRRQLVARHKSAKKEREIKELIKRGVLGVDGKPLSKEKELLRAAEANRIEEDRFKSVKEEQEKMAQYGRALKKRLRTRMQAHFHNTKTLPMDLFRAFQKFDKDASGFIEFSEFENVLKHVGLGLLDRDEMKAMFDQCDDNASGRVDFAEFLKTVVGNLTGI